MSKKEKIKKYLEEHENEVIMTIAGGITGTLMCLLGWHFGARKALTDVAGVFTKISKENGLDTEYKVIGNAIRGFDIVPKA